jgi:hypothetical protein
VNLVLMILELEFIMELLLRSKGILSKVADTISLYVGIRIGESLLASTEETFPKTLPH